MRDIVLRKAPVTPATADRPPSPPLPRTSGTLSTYIERAVSLASTAGTLFFSFLSFRATSSPAVLHQPHRLPAQDTVPAGQQRRKQAARKGIQAAHRLRHTTRRAATSLKTPVGKLAAVQVATILALFAYASATRPTGAVFADKNVGLTLQAAGLRSFLPSAPSYRAASPQEASAASAASLPLHAWLTPWNISDLENTHAAYASVSAFWLTLQADGSSLQPKADWSIWKAYHDKAANQGQLYFLTISADPNAAYLALSQPDVQAKQIGNLLQTVQQQGFDGIDIDYEGLGRENRALFTEYVRHLATAFHAAKKQVAVSLEARIANQVPMDWQAVGSLADQVRVMAYDYHSSSTDQPGSIAPIGWLKEVLDYAQENVDGKKLVIGLGNYGYDWVKPDPDSDSWQGRGISYDEAMAISQQRQAPVVRVTGIDDRGYDIGSKPAMTYKDDQQREHVVYFEDKQSLQDEVNLVSQYTTAGAILWSVGLGDKSFWETTGSSKQQ